MSQYLRNVRNGTTATYPCESKDDVLRAIQILDHFWKVSSSFYTRLVNRKHEINENTQGDQGTWSLNQFLAWAEEALPKENGSLEAVKLFLELLDKEFLKLDALDQYENSLLHFACTINKPDIVKHLLASWRG